MSDPTYPFVTELLFRAQNQSIETLSLSPIFRLWRIESLDPDTVIAQLRAALTSSTLSPKEKLKLGFLIGYSWPLHYHAGTEELLLLAKSHINESDVAESMLLWGKLASIYLRSNQLDRALEELTLALNWAKHHAKKDDIVPLLVWASLIFIRINRPREIACFSEAILAFTHAEEDTHFRQNSEYSLAIAQMRAGNYDRSQGLLEKICEKINTGNSRLDAWNQTGAVQWMAQLHYEKQDFKQAERLSAQSIELNQSEKHKILNARSQLLRYKLALDNSAPCSASAIAEQLADYQDNAIDDLDIELNQEITQIRASHLSSSRLSPRDPSSFTVSEAAIVKLQQSFHDCMHSFMLPLGMSTHIGSAIKTD